MGRNLRRIQNRSLTPLLIALCAGPATLVAAMFTILLVSVINLRGQDVSARRASDLLTESSSVERSVVDLETGLRGYLITRERSFLAPYFEAQARLTHQLAALNRLANGALERDGVRDIREGITSYLTDYARPLLQARLTRSQEIQAAVVGKRRLDALRSQFTALTGAEAALRGRRRASVERQSSRAIAAAAIGLVLSIVLLCGLGAYLVRRFLRPARTVAEAAVRLAHGDRRVRVPTVGRGEVALLATSFNTMAESLQARDEELAQAREQLEHAVEQARGAAAMKSSFLANMSHEIRTPLNGVTGMLDLLSETPMFAEQREYVSVARTSSETLMSVVNDVLDIAKIEAGGLELEQREFDLHDLIEVICDMVAGSAAAKGLEVQSFVHPEVPRLVSGDRTRVGQVLANLMSNGVKFTADGEVTLEATLVARHDATVRVQFAVTDTGIGIQPDRVADVFEPFIQADASTTRTYGGTGLGLAIVRELVRKMGGEISVEAESGRGSTFTCRVPFGASTGSLPRAVPRAELHGLRVLIVDDNATNRRIFEAYVASWGMRPALAGDATTAMRTLCAAAAGQNPFDVVLLDLNMPGRSGMDLAEEIARTASLRRVRIILLSSSAERVGEDEAIAISHVLTKPVRQSRLLDAIAHAMAEEPPRDGQISDFHAPRSGPGRHPGVRAAKILVAEDQPVNQLLVERMLANRGYRAWRASDGRQALDMFESGSWNLILMDCQMPFVDGYELTRRIRQREREQGAPHTPIVAMTAHAMPGDREYCLAIGMDDYLAKPITISALQAVLDRWLEGRDQRLPVVDARRVEELRALLPGAETGEFLAELQENIEDELQEIEQALSEDDLNRAREAAHRILGTARMLGAERVSSAAQELQSAADRVSGQAARLRLRESWNELRETLAAGL